MHRETYKISPLVEVIFQLRFPAILLINSEQPSKFQEKIREEYPHYNEKIEYINEMINISDEIQIPSQNTVGIKNYSFLSSDKTFKINLTSTFISFSTKKYTRWEEFYNKVKKLVEIFESIYKPNFYTRIGLRYIDIFTKSKWNLSDKSWHELMQPHILGIITPDDEKGTKSYLSISEYKSEDKEYMQRKRIEFVHVNNENDLSLMTDCDYFTNIITETKDVEIKVNKLHDNSVNFIQHAIQNVLREAMQPESIND